MCRKREFHQFVGFLMSFSRLNRSNTEKQKVNSVQVNFHTESWPVQTAWMAAAVQQMPLPQRELLLADCGRKTHCGEERGGSPLYKRAPGHPVDFRSRVAMVEPLAPFQNETISLIPLIPPNTHLLLFLPPFPPQFQCDGKHPASSLELQNWSEDQGAVCQFLIPALFIEYFYWSL